MNPLLDFSGLPRFDQFSVEHVTPAVDTLLAENRNAVEQFAAPEVPATWDDFVEPLEDANERLGRAWGQVAHLHAVMDNPPLREVYNANLPKITQYNTEVSQHQGLYAKYKALRSSAWRRTFPSACSSPQRSTASARCSPRSVRKILCPYSSVS